MDVADIRTRAIEFGRRIDAKKVELNLDGSFWYPYGKLNNISHLDRLLTGPNRRLLSLTEGRRIADIGSADGDLAFFLESLGLDVDIIDHAPTNYNSLRGARLLKSGLSSTVEIFDVDLDSQFTLPRDSYSLVLFLGILYHLKNPYYVLESLARVAHHCVVSTRITRFDPSKTTCISDLPVAYLLDEREANNDSTNYWIFSDAGLRRILSRTGWDICDYMTVGNTVASDPATSDGDERAFCLLRSRSVTT